MRVKVDLKNDALYLRLDESAIVESQEVRPGVILDYDANDNVVGVEMLGLGKRVPAETLKKVQIECVRGLHPLPEGEGGGEGHIWHC